MHTLRFTKLKTYLYTHTSSQPTDRNKAISKGPISVFSFKRRCPAEISDPILLKNISRKKILKPI